MINDNRNNIDIVDSTITTYILSYFQLNCLLNFLEFPQELYCGSHQIKR